MCSVKCCQMIFFIHTLGMYSASDRVPLTLTLSLGRSMRSLLELKTQSNLKPGLWTPRLSPPSVTLGLAITSQATWILSCLATPYTWTWPGLQNGLSARRIHFKPYLVYFPLIGYSVKSKHAVFYSQQISLMSVRRPHPKTCFVD